MGLAKLRKEKGLTYKQLAEKSGVNYQKLWQIEHSVIKTENIALKTAQKLADSLECSIEDILAPDDTEQE